MKPSSWRIALLAACLLVSLQACGMERATADADRTALEAAIHRWIAAVNSKDVAALQATMTADVELLDDASVISGREAAVRSLRELAADGRLTATTREITVHGDMAWQVVALAQTRRNGDVRTLGQALEIWERVDGAWKLRRRMTSGAGPGPALTRPPPNEPVLDRPKD